VAIYIVLILLLFDDRRSGGLRLPYVLAFGLFILMQFTMNFAANWQWWHEALDAYAGYHG
jgi:hypothetical protein